MNQSSGPAELPPPPANTEGAALEQYKAQLKQAERPAERKKAIADAEIALNKSFIDGTIEVAKGSIDRAQGGAKTVQSAAAAIGTLYTGVLALAFSVTDKPLPPRGVIAAVFLGAAIRLARVYLAYISRAKDTVELPQPDPEDLQKTGLGLANACVRWNRFGAFERRYWVRASIVMLGVALIFLPAPFITFTKDAPDSDATKPSWPAVADASGPPRLAAIRYKAEVAEAAAARAEFKESDSVARSHQDLAWALLGAALFVIALILPSAIGRVVDDKSDQTGEELPEDGGGKLVAPMAVQ